MNRSIKATCRTSFIAPRRRWHHKQADAVMMSLGGLSSQLIRIRTIDAQSPESRALTDLERLWLLHFFYICHDYGPITPNVLGPALTISLS
jgi:hypothetical protein